MDDNASEFRPKSPTEQRIEARFGRPAEAVVDDLYGTGLSQAQVAERLGASRFWVVEFMKRSGIPTRDRRAVTRTLTPTASQETAA